MKTVRNRTAEVKMSLEKLEKNAVVFFRTESCDSNWKHVFVSQKTALDFSPNFTSTSFAQRNNTIEVEMHSKVCVLIFAM